MLQIKKYKVNNSISILLYADQEANFPNDSFEKVGVTYEGDVLDFWGTETSTLPLLSLHDFMYSINPIMRKRTRDKILSENHVESWKDLSNNYLLVKYKSSPLSAKIRNLAVEKYLELVEYVKNPYTDEDSLEDTEVSSQ